MLDLGRGPTKLGRLLDERGIRWVGLDAAISRLKLGQALESSATRSVFRSLIAHSTP